MPIYHYQGRDKQGQSISGRLQANSSEEVATQLLEQDIIPILIDKITKGGAAMHNLLRKSGLSKPSLDDLIIFFRQMYALTRAAVPITTVITRLAESMHNVVFADVLNDIAQKVGSGLNLSTSMRAHPDIFSSLVVNTVAAGENSGQLEYAFIELSRYLEFESKAIKRIKAAMRYPIIIITAISIAIVVVTVVVIPSFAKLFTSVGAQLPFLTRMILSFSGFMVQNGVLLLLGFVSAFIAFRWYIHTAKGRLRWHRWLLHMPVFGSLVSRSLVARFARLFSIVYRAGLPLPTGIHQVSEAIDNAYISQRLTYIEEQLNKGESLTIATAGCGLFSPMVLQMLQVGEESGMLEDMLQYIAEFYEQEVDYDLARLDDLISPLIIIVLGIMVLILALGVFLPMWNIIDVALQH